MSCGRDGCTCGGEMKDLRRAENRHGDEAHQCRHGHDGSGTCCQAEAEEPAKIGKGHEH